MTLTVGRTLVKGKTLRLYFQVESFEEEDEAGVESRMSHEVLSPGSTTVVVTSGDHCVGDNKHDISAAALEKDGLMLTASIDRIATVCEDRCRESLETDNSTFKLEKMTTL